MIGIGWGELSQNIPTNCQRDLMIYLILSGWWFGTFFIFPYLRLLIIPIDFHIFSEGWPNHQPAIETLCICMNLSQPWLDTFILSSFAVNSNVCPNRLKIRICWHLRFTISCVGRGPEAAVAEDSMYFNTNNICYDIYIKYIIYIHIHIVFHL